MRTISTTITLYNSVLNGKICLSQNHLIFSSGVLWIVDGRFTDTIENKKGELDFIITNVELAKSLLICIGEDVGKMYEEYYLIRDGNMFFLVKKDKDLLVLIHITESIVETSAMLEQIDTKKGTIKCHYFKQRFDEIEPKMFYLQDNLSTKSKKLIVHKLKQQEFSITQNFFYDMLTEGMTNYHDLMQAIINNPIITPNEPSINKIVLRFSNRS